MCEVLHDLVVSTWSLQMYVYTADGQNYNTESETVSSYIAVSSHRAFWVYLYL